MNEKTAKENKARKISITHIIFSVIMILSGVLGFLSNVGSLKVFFGICIVTGFFLMFYVTEAVTILMSFLCTSLLFILIRYIDRGGDSITFLHFYMLGICITLAFFFEGFLRTKKKFIYIICIILSLGYFLIALYTYLSPAFAEIVYYPHRIVYKSIYCIAVIISLIYLNVYFYRCSAEHFDYQRRSFDVEEKYAYRGECSVFLTLLSTLLFFFVWVQYVQDHNNTGHLLGAGNLAMAFVFYFLIFIFCGNALGAYTIGVNKVSRVVASEAVSFFLTDIIEIFVSLLIIGEFRFFWSILWRYFLLFLVQTVVIGLITIPLIHIYRRRFPALQLLQIYGKDVDHTFSKMELRPDKYHIGGKVSYLDGMDKIISEMEGYDALLLQDLPDDVESELIQLAFEYNKRIYYVPKISDILIKSSSELNLFDTPLYYRRNHGMSMTQRFVKRLLDIVLSGFALAVLSPLFGIVALAIKLEDGGPVFYRQERCTWNMKKFMILKFRSMIVNAEADGKSHPAGEKDDRITKVGHVIRATRIDELPQLINILKGDMSIIGPRPERVEHVEKYCAEIPEFKYRYKVKGGLSGLAQVYGKYNTTAMDKLKMDLMYITNYSLVLDVEIVFETFKIIFQKESTEGFSEEAQGKIMNSEVSEVMKDMVEGDTKK